MVKRTAKNARKRSKKKTTIVSLSLGYSIEPADVYVGLDPLDKEDVDTQLLKQLVVPFDAKVRARWAFGLDALEVLYLRHSEIRKKIQDELSLAKSAGVKLASKDLSTTTYRVIAGEHRIVNVEALMLNGRAWVLRAELMKFGQILRFRARAELSLSWGIALADLGIPPKQGLARPRPRTTHAGF